MPFNELTSTFNGFVGNKRTEAFLCEATLYDSAYFILYYLLDPMKCHAWTIKSVVVQILPYCNVCKNTFTCWLLELSAKKVLDILTVLHLSHLWLEFFPHKKQSPFRRGIAVEQRGKTGLQLVTWFLHHIWVWLANSLVAKLLIDKSVWRLTNLAT